VRFVWGASAARRRRDATAAWRAMFTRPSGRAYCRWPRPPLADLRHLGDTVESLGVARLRCLPLPPLRGVRPVESVVGLPAGEPQQTKTISPKRREIPGLRMALQENDVLDRAHELPVAHVVAAGVRSPGEFAEAPELAADRSGYSTGFQAVPQFSRISRSTLGTRPDRPSLRPAAAIVWALL
jgi:hypothetical protein